MNNEPLPEIGMVMRWPDGRWMACNLLDAGRWASGEEAEALQRRVEQASEAPPGIFVADVVDMGELQGAGRPSRN